MIAADRPLHPQQPAAKLLHVDARRRIAHLPRSAFARLLAPGDLVVANDAATLPASLHGTHLPTGAALEIRLAGRRSLDVGDIRELDAVVFGSGDFRMRTEHRPPPPRLVPGDELALGPLRATVLRVNGHPRFVALAFHGSPEQVWAGLARHGKPIQYSHAPSPLALWDVWTSNAAVPVAFEPPSAGFALSWQAVADIRARGAVFATLTHAAGLSSTGDAELDARLPLPEPYFIPPATADLVRLTRWNGDRVIAIGTTVVRALEHAAIRRGPDKGGVRNGASVATQRLGADSRLAAVDAVLTGTHEPGTSHYELLRAFAPDRVLECATGELESHAYRTHEFGDSVLVETPRVRDSWRTSTGRLRAA